jgi:hypothetical protein
MTVYKLCLSILILISIALPQSIIQISGKVITTDSIPISGAVVELKKNEVNSTTDSLGKFILIDTLSQPTVLSKSVIDLSPSFYISQNHLNLNLQRETTISIEVYDITGKKINVLISGRFKTGNYSIPITLKNLPSQVYFLRLKFGSNVEYLKLCTIQKDINFKQKLNQPMAMVLSKTATVTSIDTLIVTHNMFQPVKFPVVDIISSIVIVLSKKPSIPHVWAFTDFGKMKDTIISQKDSIFVGIGATDSIDTIKEYYWDIGGNGWCDSTSKADSSFKLLKYPTGGYIPIIIGARNKAGFLGTDTFHILFNRPPVSCGLKTDYNADKGGWSDFNYSTENGSIQVSFKGEDPDVAHDNLKYDLYWGTDSNSLSKKYSGVNTTILISDIPIQTQFYWKVVAKDLYGDSIQNTGSYSSNGLPPNGVFWNITTETANIPDNQWETGQYTAISYDNKMWMFITGMGSTNYGKRLVYNSTDGISWNLVTDNANLPDNQWVTGQYTAISYDNKMWMFITGIGSTNYGKRIVSTSGK